MVYHLDGLNVTHADREAAVAWVCAKDKGYPTLQEAFAAHRQAALLEGVRIGLEAAEQDALTWFPAGTEGKHVSGGVVGSIRALDPAEVLARNGGA